MIPYFCLLYSVLFYFCKNFVLIKSENIFPCDLHLISTKLSNGTIHYDINFDFPSINQLDESSKEIYSLLISSGNEIRIQFQIQQVVFCNLPLVVISEIKPIVCRVNEKLIQHGHNLFNIIIYSDVTKQVFVDRNAHFYIDITNARINSPFSTDTLLNDDSISLIYVLKRFIHKSRMLHIILVSGIAYKLFKWKFPHDKALLANSNSHSGGPSDEFKPPISNPFPLTSSLLDSKCSLNINIKKKQKIASIISVVSAALIGTISTMIALSTRKIPIQTSKKQK